MRYSKLASAAAGAFGAHLGRYAAREARTRVYSWLLKLSKNGLTSTIYVNESMLSDFLKINDIDVIRPELIKQTSVCICDQSRDLDVACVPSGIVVIDGVPCYISTTAAPAALIVPKYGFDRIRDKYQAYYDHASRPRKVNYHSPVTFTPRQGPSGPTWISSRKASSTRLDDMPIHTETRKILNGHIDRMWTEWRDRENTDYTRNLIFYGPKGSGKSNLSVAIANELKTAYWEFPIPDASLEFTDMIGSFSGRFGVMCVDEAESLPIFCPDYRPEKCSSLSTRDLLNYFAGATSPKGSMTILCTNEPDKIDDRFRRRGRFKEEILIDKVDSDGIKYWLDKKYNHIVPESTMLSSTLCAELFDLMDTLDDPAVLVKRLTIRRRTRKTPAPSTPK